MFEDSLVESRVLPISLTKRWTALASISLQFAVAAVVIALPLLHPEAMQFHEDSPKVLLPLLPKPPAPPVRVERVTDSSSITSPGLPRTITISSLLPTKRGDVNDEPALVAIDPGMGTPVWIASGTRCRRERVTPELDDRSNTGSK